MYAKAWLPFGERNKNHSKMLGSDYFVLRLGSACFFHLPKRTLAPSSSQ